jgi:hypothetical protein
MLPVKVCSAPHIEANAERLCRLTHSIIEVLTIIQEGNVDFISLTDMLKAKDGDFFISDWLRNRNTVEFLGIWESVYNPDFNYGEFAAIRSQAGLHNYKISVKEWMEKTHAIGLRATAGEHKHPKNGHI